MPLGTPPARRALRFLQAAEFEIFTVLVFCIVFFFILKFTVQRISLARYRYSCL